MDIHEEPTVSWGGGEQTQGEVGGPPAAVATATKTGKGHGFSRRNLLIGLAGAGVATTAAGVGLAEWVQHSGLSAPFAGPRPANVQIGHLLRRAGFGATPQELAAYTALGYNGSVDRLLNYQQVSDDAMETRLKAMNFDLNKLQDQQRWWLLRMAWTQRPLLEKMTLFWHGFLTSSYHDVGGKDAYMRMIVQNNFLRSHAFDTYDNMLLGITADPAMLFYLDLTKSKKNAPNENYARELMELFTLGLGNYTQQDVYEAAAALTGWHVVGKTTSSHYLPADHNNREKTYLGQKGNLDYKDVIRILANHPATPWFLCRHLFTFFVYENPSNDDLKPLVDSYIKSNHNMGAVMRTLLLSPQFNSDKAYRSRVKSPTEFVVGAYRSLNIQSDGAALPVYTTGIGQELFNPPNVAGWPADKVSAYWLNSGTWMTRLNYINYLLTPNRSKTVASKGLDLQAVIDEQHIDAPEHFVEHFAGFLLDGELAVDRKALLVEHFTTPASGASKTTITLTNGKRYALSSARGVLYLLMSLPEYQLN